jgi:hypothetical protein
VSIFVILTKIMDVHTHTYTGGTLTLKVCRRAGGAVDVKLVASVMFCPTVHSAGTRLACALPDRRAQVLHTRTAAFPTNTMQADNLRVCVVSRTSE